MTRGDLAFIAMAINPIGGLNIAIPFAIFELDYSPWLAIGAGVPLAYVQIIIVDLFWSALSRWDRFKRFIERKRSPRIQRIVDSRGGFWVTLVFSPFIGGWVVMALMRYAGVPQRKVALPLLLGLTWISGALAAACFWAPKLIGR